MTNDTGTGTADAPAGPAGFAALGLSEPLVKAVTALGYEEPTAVQRETIPAMLRGGDLLVQAATGTGKTAAFALPILQRLAGLPAARHATRALVLVPTRELAIQVAEAVHRYSRGSSLHVVPVYGGAPLPVQVRALQRGADIVVATPGRALDHLRRGTLELDGLLVLVLDEADEMLDMGFAEELDAILLATPESRQTTLFSATMPARIASIARRHLRDAARVTVAGERTAAGRLPRVRQVAYIARRDQKADVLGRVLDLEAPESAIVFCRTRLEVDALVESLESRGFRAVALHGGFAQRQRDAVMARFRAAKADLLIATDVAARGLDIRQLSHVVNYDLPASADAYVHRIGRTGRAGREGTAITLVEPREARHLRSIEALTRQKIEVAPIPSVADLRARRLAATRESLRERLLEGKLTTCAPWSSRWPRSSTCSTSPPLPCSSRMPRPRGTARRTSASWRRRRRSATTASAPVPPGPARRAAARPATGRSGRCAVRRPGNSARRAI
jgi:ATP-dependent RNA helicase DeaD